MHPYRELTGASNGRVPSRVIGIDLGTTNSTVNGWEVGEVGLLRDAAANGDLFVKSANAAGGPVFRAQAPDAHENDDDDGFL